MSSKEELFDRILASVKSRQPKLPLDEEPTAVVETAQGDESAAGLPAPREEQYKTAAATPENFLRNTETHPIILDLVLLNKYGVDWLGWEPETLVAKLQEDFHTFTVADVNIEKMQACKVLHLVDDFWLRWEVFLPCVAAFNGHLADFDNMQVPTVAECMLAVDIANRIRDDVQWSGELKTYLAVVHKHDSELVPQAPLEFVTVDTDDLHVDCEEVRRRWPEVRAKGQLPSGASIEDEQLRKMLGSWVYLEAMRTRLQSQLLTVLKHV
jgi:hypothetical protein